ncbi:hypothetical protein [Echinicola sp. 20G]|uniref:hypothetical protein n=1 Tax=Echinicola sp. 20G TaxID=2781961 RepID=UPI00191062E0|nr:hypothetical protein [Echinicola sp. 20G]
MKINQTKWRGLQALSLVFAILFLANCGKKDIETLDPYDYQSKKFEAVEDIPDVEDPEPEVQEPETGSVENPEVTTAAISNLEGAGSEGEISTETKNSLEQISNFSAPLSADFKTAAKEIDEAGLDKILDADQALDEAFKGAEKALEDAPTEVLAMLPQMELTEDFDILEEGNRVKAEEVAKFFEERIPNYRMSALTGACSDAAQQAYDEKIQKLDEQKESALTVIEENYERRVTEADERYTTRKANHDENYEVELAKLRTSVIALYNVADKIEAFSASFAETIRYFAVIYAVHARTTIEVWCAKVVSMLEAKRDAEKEKALELKEMRTAQVMELYNERVEKADELLEAAFEACHNQGSGN